MEYQYYPPNINHSRCCDQAICTECFVQIKRSEPTTTHLVSEPAACPYCVQDNFGVVYKPPPWRTGIGSDGMVGVCLCLSFGLSLIPLSTAELSLVGFSQRQPVINRYFRTLSCPQAKTEELWCRQSRGSDNRFVYLNQYFPTVIQTFGHKDQIRPDWEAKLAAVQAAVTRRANRRIIMRQVGDRLIPVGVTSGRVHPLSAEEAAAAENAEGSGSRRSRRRQQPPANAGFEQYIGIGGQDLEEVDVSLTIRRSQY